MPIPMQSSAQPGRSCTTCNKPLPPAASTGRPARYCSVPCRRAAALAITRVNRRLMKLERALSRERVTAECNSGLLDIHGRDKDARIAGLKAEIQDAERQLLQLLGDQEGRGDG